MVLTQTHNATLGTDSLSKTTIQQFFLSPPPPQAQKNLITSPPPKADKLQESPLTCLNSYSSDLTEPKCHKTKQ